MKRPRTPIPLAFALIALLAAACGEAAPDAPTGTELAAQAERAPRESEPAEPVRSQPEEPQAAQEEAVEQAGDEVLADEAEDDSEPAADQQERPGESDAAALPYNIKGDLATARVHIINYGDFQ